MPRKFILGSGITGLLAKEILGADWEIIPFGRSRFYTYAPPLADNIIGWHDEINEVLRKYTFNTIPIRYQRAYSYGGELIFSDESFAKQYYLDKVFGGDPHPAAKLLLRSSSNVYDLSVYSLYNKLLGEYEKDLARKSEHYGKLVKIDGNQLQFSKTTVEFDKLVSTIPLPALYEYLGVKANFPSRDVWYYHVETPALNFESAAEVLVCDAPYDFFKVNLIGPNQYVFHCLRDLGNPQAYLGAFMRNQLRILNQTTVKDAVPIGPPAVCVPLEAKGIYPVGCHAQWDHFMDVGASIRRLLKLRNV